MKTIILDGVQYVPKKEADAEITKISKGKVKIVDGKALPFEIGGKYLIRTVTYFATGEVESIKGGFLVLKDAAWVADTGRFRDAIATGALSEVEPVETMILNTAAITDAFPWQHALPREQK